MVHPDELEEIVAACADGTTSVVLVAGVPGSNRASVLDDAATAADQLGLHVVRARARWPDREIGYALLRDVLRPVLRVVPDLPRSVLHVLRGLGVLDGPEAEADQQAACVASALAVEEAAATKPLAVIVDDLQWADGPSAMVLAYLARRAADLRACFVCSTVTPLAVDAPVRALEVLAEAVIRLDDPSAGESATVLHQRLGEASPRSRRVALALALLDGRGGPADLAATAELTVQNTLEALAELQELGLLHTELELARPLVHELRLGAPLDRLAFARRAAHALASSSDPDPSAELLLTLPSVHEQWAADVLTRAADRAARAREHGRAVKLYTRSLEEAPTDRAEVCARLARSAVHTDIDLALARLDDAVAAGLDTDRSVEIACTVATAALPLARVDIASAALERAHAWSFGPSRVLSTATAHAIGSLMPLERQPPDLDVSELPGTTPAERSALAIAAFVAAQHGGPISDAAALALRASGGGMLAHEHADDAAPVYFAVDVLVDGEEFASATSLLDELVGDAQARGDAGAFHRHSAVRAYARVLMGDIRGAESDARLAIDAELTVVDEPLAAGALIEALTLRGEFDQAEELAALYVSSDETIVTTAIVSAAAARLALERRRYEEAVELSERVARIEIAQGRRGVPVLWRSTAASAAAALGDGERAQSLAQEELDIAARTGHRRGLVVGMLATAAVADRKERLPLLRRAQDLALDARSPVVRASALLAYGAELRRRNRHVEARAPLHDAASLARACGADAIATTALTELRAAGGRPRRVATTGPDALTSTERRVAEEAQLGLTNAEIAAKLFVSRKTVEMHLSRVYRKLAIASRAELRRLRI